ncbi:RNA polymerase sigma-54 factor [Inhella inkyongensis]|uniref:RNA polymerase sigma-54 factor n=1 Tax=Inhella inkyongensis TaxID=392593 RepID=A0A840RW85_9BURK|nr:RNA polymerase factor sigma-54 [Inhella inkyongensis]MBB5202937.1 RNA polymerase sigma-54 factor [Inhella inkyongensis]
MKPSLQLRQSQHLALTPQLQQSIRLLQLSTLELQQEVEQMLDSNPLLELDADEDLPLPGADSVSQVVAETREERIEAAGEGGDEVRELQADDFGTTEHEDWANGTEGDDFDGIRELPALGNAVDDDESPRGEAQSAATSLTEHLLGQLIGHALSDLDRDAVLLLIGSLNADGYLADELEALADDLAAKHTEPREELLDSLRMALALVQSLDPAGVGARDLSECLLLQLREQAAHPQCELATKVCAKHLELLARRDWRRLALLTHSDEPQLRLALALIARLEPKPGRAFGESDNTPVVPDVIVRRQGRQWVAQINPEVCPKLRVNELYARLLKNHRGSSLAGPLQEARWFIKNIQQRFDTIQRVSQAIVERQDGFFNHGELAMRPLVLREIAEELGLHESTISRVTTAKYMATPHGTFELKYFFGSGLNTEAGGEASSTAVRALIRQFIDAESKKKPLSDSALAAMLEEQGIQCARRTVAKYREGMKIPTAPLRKE